GVEVDTHRADLKQYTEQVLGPVNAMRGDELPVSAFVDGQTGTLPSGTSAYEKRAIAVDVPKWIPENCIQCNQCSYVCPHGVIRPFVFDENEAAGAPEGAQTLKMIGKGCENFKFAIIPSVLDCTGCGNCADICPGRKVGGETQKALAMTPIAEMLPEQPIFDYASRHVSEKETPFAVGTVKGSQFRQPLLEFSGACAGCGETPYAKLVTQLFGDRMFIANATGCSSIWGGSAPSTPYTVDKNGRGPAWINSLFEDNAEAAMGMLLGVKQRRLRVMEDVKALAAHEWCWDELKAAAEQWLAAYDDGEASKTASALLLEKLKEGIDVGDGSDWPADVYAEYWDAELKGCKCPACTLARKILAEEDLLIKPSVWAFGGDGWAYDIGYGGLDHVLASGEDINVLVFDTEVYSNTGGQASKSTPTGAVAQFAAGGKPIKKKDLAQMAMSYGYVYVAQIAMGANYQQTLKAFQEAESYHGPSIVICYAPCINHGNRKGMGKSIETEKDVVDAGYWHMFRFDPRLAADGKNPLTLDSKAPTASYRDFILSEVRYSSLTLAFPERAEELFTEAEAQAKAKYEHLAAEKAMFDGLEGKQGPASPTARDQ
ncbi:MAG: thiamine pyrophosphate-dependent enzyme, partial [Firmicutes bacterium]|nr:thiamine pyrophosphate-dependent enzyme [Bacillota bacterium]